VDANADVTVVKNAIAMENAAVDALKANK